MPKTLLRNRSFARYSSFLIMFVVLLSYTSSAYSQLNSHKVVPDSRISFASGEKLSYSVTYSSAIIKTTIADVRLSVENYNYHNIPAYRAVVRANTRPFYNMFFKLDNTYESILDKQTLRPLFYATKLREGGYRYESTHTYDWDSKVVNTTGHNIKKSRHYSHTQPLGLSTYDAMALFFNIRCLDSESIDPGYSLTLDLVLEESTRPISFKFVGREIYTIDGVGKFRTLKFVGDLAANSADEGFEDGSQFYIWISDDKNHVPIFMESPLKVGRIQGSLSKWEGLKYPFESLIERY